MVTQKSGQAPCSVRGHWRVLLGVLALAALVFAVYHPLLPGSFLMDDRRLVETDNSLVNGTARPSSIWFREDFPLSTFAFWLEWCAWGPNPGGYHIVNMVLHALSAILLWRLLARLKIPGAWLAAAVFAVHPVCVATVGRIAELKNTLSLPFFLLSICFFICYEEESLAQGKGALWLGLSLVAFVLALLAKTSTVMLPLILLACAAWQRRRLTWLDALRASPFFILSFGFGLMSIWFQKHQALAGKTTALMSHGFLERLAISARAFWFYLGKALWPVNLGLVYPPWKVDPTSLAAYVPLLLVLAMAFVCWWFRKSWGRHALFGLACFGLALFPALGFFDAQFLTRWQVSDHLQYLPLIAPVALAVGGLMSLPGRPLFGGVTAVMALGLSILSFERARIFSTEESLFRAELARNPAAWGVENDLGTLLAARGAEDEAIQHFEACLRVQPDYADAHANLGRILFDRKQIGEAQDHFLQALKTQPNHAASHRYLGNILAQQGRFRDAARHYRIAMLFQPDLATRLDYANALRRIGDYAGAAGQFRLVLQEKPDSVEALNNLAWLLATCPDDKVRNGAEAVRNAEKASHLPQPKGMCVPGTLAAAYAEAGRFKEAIATAENAVKAETEAGETQFANLNTQLLDSYRAGQAWHEPPPRKNPYSLDDN